MKSVDAKNAALIRRYAEMCGAVLGDRLTGVYLHGSAAMGCFNPRVSDIDIIVVTEGTLSDEERRALLSRTADMNGEAPEKGIEMSAVRRADLKPFVYPTPFETHFSPAHLARWRSDPEEYVAHMRGVDPDLAAHCTVIVSRGVALCGAPIGAVFGEVPAAACLDSIRADVFDAAARIAENPVYAILNFCRALAFAREGQVLSKREGGQWAESRLPERFRGLVAGALRAYGTDGRMAIDAETARAFARWMTGEIDSAAGIF